MYIVASNGASRRCGSLAMPGPAESKSAKAKPFGLRWETAVDRGRIETLEDQHAVRPGSGLILQRRLQREAIVRLVAVAIPNQFDPQAHRFGRGPRSIRNVALVGGGETRQGGETGVVWKRPAEAAAADLREVERVQAPASVDGDDQTAVGAGTLLNEGGQTRIDRGTAGAEQHPREGEVAERGGPAARCRPGSNGDLHEADRPR
ncbi:MAG: hypothetical protein ACYTFH_05740, partial [Planctomycetota bacterium]